MTEKPTLKPQTGSHRDGRPPGARGAATRAAAARCIALVESGTSLADSLPKHTAGLDPRDRAFVAEIVYGTLRHRRLLSRALGKYLKRPLNREFAAVRALILCGLYQLVFTRTPKRAAVSATVGAASLLKAGRLTGLVNALLRGFLRDGASLPPAENPAVEHSFPDWLYSLIAGQYAGRASAILRESNERAPMWLRVENSKIGTADYLRLLRDQAVAASASPLSPGAVRLEAPVPVDRLPLFAQGRVAVQDLAAQLAVPLLEPRGRERILDACCAPGGKSAQILDLAENCELVACDISAERLSLTARELRRLGRQAELKLCDARGLEGVEGEFDKILADVPCSGTGVIRRHPDIKWLRRERDIAALCRTQDQILDTLFARLKKGGILVYSTCSILRAENEERLERLLSAHPDARPLPFEMNGVTGAACQRLPGDDGGDGFFYARVQKA